MTGILQDVRFAVRLLVKDRWIALAAVTALALGMAVNTTVFTLVNAILLRGLPFDESDRIMWIGSRDARGRELGVSFQDFEDWQPAVRTFSQISIVGAIGAFNVSDEGHVPEQYQGAAVSSNIFELIRQRPILGRTFQPDDDRPGAPGVMVLGYNLWKNRYNRDPAVLGRTIKANGLIATVIGVMPEGVRFPPNADYWTPASQLSASFRATLTGRDRRFYPVLGRLADGVTIPKAQAELAGIAAQLARQYPTTNKDVVPTVVPYNDRLTGGQIRLTFLSLMGAVAFVLLIACGNVANLLLARAAHRAREISIRVALGATRGRIVRQLLVESLLLAIISGVVGLALAIVGIRLFDAAIQDVGKPSWMEFTLDPIVFAFLAVVSLGTSLLFGLAPALHVSKTNVNEALKESGRTGSAGVRARHWTAALIVGELALTLVLLAGAGFMIRSFLNLYQMDRGIDTSHLLLAQVRMPSIDYPTTEDRTTFIERLDERLGTLSGTLDGATTTSVPPFGGGATRRVSIDRAAPQDADQLPTVTAVAVGPRYFNAIGLGLMRGRAFAREDGRPGRENAIVNQRFVALHFPAQDPLGRRIRLTDQFVNGPPTAWLTIVGVVPNVRQGNFQDLIADPVVYLPIRGDPNPVYVTTIMTRSRSDVTSVTRLLQAEVRALDPDIPLNTIRTMDQMLALQRWPARVFGSMFALFGFIALVLSAVGLYAVTSYSVIQRTQEIGVRMALGAQPPQVWWLVFKRALVHLAIGLVIGMAGAIGVGRLLQSMVVQTSPTDLVTLGAIATILVAVALAACFLPARRATRLSPTVALRYE